MLSLFIKLFCCYCKFVVLNHNLLAIGNPTQTISYWFQSCAGSLGSSCDHNSFDRMGSATYNCRSKHFLIFGYRGRINMDLYQKASNWLACIYTDNIIVVRAPLDNFSLSIYLHLEGATVGWDRQYLASHHILNNFRILCRTDHPKAPILFFIFHHWNYRSTNFFCSALFFPGWSAK